MPESIPVKLWIVFFFVSISFHLLYIVSKVLHIHFAFCMLLFSYWRSRSEIWFFKCSQRQQQCVCVCVWYIFLFSALLGSFYPFGSSCIPIHVCEYISEREKYLYCYTMAHAIIMGIHKHNKKNQIMWNIISTSSALVYILVCVEFFLLSFPFCVYCARSCGMRDANVGRAKESKDRWREKERESASGRQIVIVAVYVLVNRPVSLLLILIWIFHISIVNINMHYIYKSTIEKCLHFLLSSLLG